MARPSKPPLTLADARVVEYAHSDHGVSYSGHSSLFVDGVELGAVPRLALCQTAKDDEVLLLHCDREWNVLGVAAYKSVMEAKTKAEHIYPGISALWIKTRAGGRATESRVGYSTGEPRCSFCGKGPNEVDQMIEKGDVRICDSCVGDFQRMLRESS